MKNTHINIKQTLLLIILAIGVAGTTTAQQTTSPDRGSKLGNAYSVSDIETINTTNGNLSISFPLGSLPAGRGSASSGVYLTYNSKLYNQKSEKRPDYRSFDAYYTRTILEPDLVKGNWSLNSGYRLEQELRPMNGVQCSTDYGFNLPILNNQKLSILFPDGSRHEMIPYYHKDELGDRYFNVNMDGYIQSCTNPNGSYVARPVYYSLDGSYLRLKTTSSSNWTLYFPDGSKVVNGTRVYDRNGNYVDVGMGVTDQFGRSIVVGSNSVGTTVTSKGVGGADLVWQVKWKTIAVNKTYKGCPDDLSCPAGDFPLSDKRDVLQASFTVVDEIIQPSQLGGGTYTFTYNGTDYTTTFPTAESYGWGELSGIEMPSGAKVAYAYNMDDEDGPIMFGDDAILKNYPTTKTLTYDLEYDGQVVNDGAVETWTYSVGPTGGSVTGPDGATTTTEFGTTQPDSSGNLPWNSGLALSTISPNGAKVENIWDRNIPAACTGSSTCASGTGPEKADNPYIKTEFTSIKDAGGTYTLTSAKDYIYDKNGNVTEAKEYDWMPYSSVPRSYGYPTGLPSNAASYLKRISKTDFYNDVPTASSTNYSDSDAYQLTTSPRLLRLAKAAEVQDSSSTAKSRSEIVYDYTTYSSNTVAGNVTQTKSWDSTKGAYSNPLTSTNWITTSATYNSYGMPLTSTDANGNVTQITYGNVAGPSGNVTDLYPTQSVSAHGTSIARTTTSTYDYYTGLVTSTTDEDNDVTSAIEYDDLGRPLKSITAQGTALESWTSTTYNDALRRVIVKSDLETKGDYKKVAVQHFDQLGRVRLSRTLEDSSVEDPTNEQHGIKTQTRHGYHSGAPTSSNGEYTLTSNPYRAATSGAASSASTMAWTVTFENSSGNFKSVESFAGAGLPSLWGTNANSTGKVDESEDANATTTIDEAGKKRRTIEDAFGRLIRVDEPDSGGNLGSITSPSQDTNYNYDTLGNLIQIVQGGQTRAFTFNSQSRLTSSTNPESGTFQFAYDNNGNLLTKADARGISTTYTYDALNRVTYRNYSDATLDVTYTYDDGQVSFSKGKLTKVASSVSESSITSFDAQERVTGSRQQTSGQNYDFIYTYNLNDDLLTQTYPSGRVVESTYDASGDLIRVGRTNGFSYANSFTYAPSGQTETLRFGNGRWETTQFNSRRQITQIGLGYSATDTSLWKTNYEYGDWVSSSIDTQKNNGNLARQTITIPTIGAVSGFTAVQSYTYDSIDRLKSATETISGSQTWKQTFNYDRSGNKSFDTGNTTLQSVDSLVAKVTNPEILTTNNRFKLDQDNDSVNDYGYDSSGNLTANARGQSFTYNAENLQITATGAGLNMAYAYDGNNKRIKSYDAINDRTTLFVYDAEGNLAAEYTINSVPPTTPTVSYLTEDALGSLRVISDSYGDIKARRDFLPYGEEIYSGVASRNSNQKYSSNTDDTRKKFATYQRDIETGLDFAQSRYYSGKHGRFTSPDEFKGGPDELFDFDEDASDNPTFYADLDNPQSLNKYQYSFNSPYKFNDPTGHCPWCRLLASPAARRVIDGAIRQGSRIVSSVRSAVSSAAPVFPVIPRVAPTISSVAPVVTKAAPAVTRTASRSTNIWKNASKGKNFEAKVTRGLRKGNQNVQRQVTIKTQSGLRTRVDNLATRKGNIRVFEAKSSQGARLTSNQKKAFAEIEKSGGVVVGKGKPGYEGGTLIPPQTVKVIRGSQ